MYLRIEGCIPVSSSCPGTRKISEVHVGQENLRVHLSSIWTFQYPPHIYKASPSSHGILAEAGTVIDHLPGQHSDYASVQGRLATPGGIDNATAGVFGLYHQQREITAESIPVDPVPRVPSGLQVNEILPPRGESTGYNTDLSRDPDSRQVVNLAAITVAGQVECGIPSNTVSPSTLL